MRLAATLDEHVGQLAAAVHAGRGAFTGRAFIEAFIRPRGMDVPAAGVFADAIEAELRAAPPAPAAEPLSAPLRRAVLAPVAALARRIKPRRKAATDDKDAGVATPAARRLLFVISSPEYFATKSATFSASAPTRMSCGIGPDEKPPLRIA